jgi:glycosyltransferase involved in cell wall biosynthesis
MAERTELYQGGAVAFDQPMNAATVSSGALNLCFIIRRLDRGGAERQLLSLARGLCRGPYHLTIVELYDGGAMSDEVAAIPGARRVCVGKRGRWDVFGFFSRYIRAMREIDPDIIHGYLYVANILAVLSKPFLKHRARVVMGIRSSNSHLEHYDWSLSLSSWLERKLSRFADLIIANSRAGYDYSCKLGFPVERMAMVHNGIDVERYRPALQEGRAVRREWGIGDGDKLIGLVARFDPKKNHPLFLKAAAKLAQKMPEARFACIGACLRPGYLEQLKGEAASLGIADKVLWPGPRTDISAIYSALDLCTLCSNAAEGFPNVLAEAMACGTPCVASDCGESREIIGDLGIIVDDCTPENLSAAWQAVLGWDRAETGAKTRRRIVERFSVETLATRTAEQLTKIT